MAGNRASRPGNRGGLRAGRPETKDQIPENVQIEVLKSKIHRAVVTYADLHYVGSITIDEDLMDAANLMEYERVHIYDINNGERLDTYVIKGKRGSGIIGLNGAAARRVAVGDLVIIVSYASMTPEEARLHEPVVVFPENNRLPR